MRKDSMIALRIHSSEVEQIDQIARRHCRKRSSLIHIMIKTLLVADQKGELERIMLENASWMKVEQEEAGV